MKRLLLSLLVLITALDIPLHADTVTFDFASMGYGNGDPITTATQGDVTLTFSSGGNNNSPKYYTTGKGVRLYPKNAVEISLKEGNITSVQFNFSGGNYTFLKGIAGDVTVSAGTYTEPNPNPANIGTWTGSGSTVIIGMNTTATKGSCRIQSMTVTYTAESNPDIVAAPVISVAGDEWSERTVTISAQDGAAIYFTLDGTDPTTSSEQYTSETKLSVVKTTTVKAIAAKDGKFSSIAEKEVTVNLYAPTFTPAGGTYPEPQNVTLKSTHATEIWYTTDGSDPVKDGAASKKYTAGTPIVVEDAMTIKAIAYNGNVVSAISTASYEINSSLKQYDLNVNDATEIIGTYAEEVTEGSNRSGAKYQPLESLTLGDFSFTFDKGTGSTAPAYYYATSTSSKQQQTIRIYNGNTMTVTAPKGYAITSIAYTGDIKGIDNPWRGTATSVVITPTASTRIETMEIEVVEATLPIFDYPSGTYYDSFNLTLSTILSDAKIYYTTDGTRPTTSSTLYTAPIKIERGKAITVKAIAVGKNEEGETVTSEVASATYTWGEVGQSFGSLQELYDYITATHVVNGKYEYVNTEGAVTLDFPVSVAALSKTYLYIDDTFQLGGVNSMAVTRKNTDWTEYYEAGDIIKRGMVVTWSWENAVTPLLALQNEPVDVDDSFNAYLFEPDEATVAEINASAEWNQEEIDFAIIGKEPVPMIALLNPDLVSQCVLIKNVEFTANTKANTGSTPKGTFTGKSADGESIKFITRLPVSSYAKGTYDVTGVVGYTVTITKEKVNEIGDITTAADTTITAVVYPVAMKAVTGGGEIEEPTEAVNFVAAESIEAGEYLISAGNLAFTPLADSKTYGYMPAKEIKLEGDSARADASYAVTLIVSDYTDANRGAATYYYLQDALGRYIYQTGTYNSFNLSATLPENIAEASWIFVTDYEGDKPVMKITNAATEKWIQYSEKYESFGCYPDVQGILPSVYVATEPVSGIGSVEAETTDGPVEVYNLQGIRMGSKAEGLPAGLYIIRRGTTVSKVIVR